MKQALETARTDYEMAQLNSITRLTDAKLAVANAKLTISKAENKTNILNAQIAQKKAEEEQKDRLNGLG